MDTKVALSNALKEMMRKKSIEKITITDLTNIVGINRQTFYYHFHDIYELIEFIYYRETMNAIGDMKTIETWQQGLLRLFYATLEQKEFVESTFRSISREKAEDFLFQIMYDLIINAIDETSAADVISSQDKVLIADFYKHALIGMLLTWIKNGMKEEPEKYVQKIEIVARDGFLGAISSFVSDAMSS